MNKMKLRYYMRGLGIGVVVTALIMGITLGQKKTMSDEEVKKRAGELGMVESTVLSGMPGSQPAEPEQQTAERAEPESSEPESAESEPAEPESAESELAEPELTESEPTESESSEPESTESESSEPEELEPEGSDADVQEPETTQQAESAPEDVAEPSEAGETVTITVKKGDSSVSVSRRLAEAGLVPDAGEYDKYLCSNRYDKSIAVGTYEIPMGATMEEIAKIITKK